MSTSHASLGAASDDRKARLAKLKTLKRKQPADEIVAPESERAGSLPAAEPVEPTNTTTNTTLATRTAKADEPSEKEQQDEEELDVARLHLSGRNYDVEAKGPKLGFEAPPTLGLEDRTLEAQAAGVEAEVRRRAAEEAAGGGGIDLFKLQPRKPNWDLKRDLGRKLEVLGVRTDNAIARLVRERITSAQKKAESAGAGAGPGAGASDNNNNNHENGGDRDGEAAGMEGVALVEGVRVREREEEEDERRERQEEENDLL